jgi:hypothetical protein
MVFPAVAVSRVDAAVRELDVPVAVRQLVLARPFRDLTGVTVGPTVPIWSSPVAVVEPPLILPLQLVVEPHSLDVCAARLEPRRVPFVGGWICASWCNSRSRFTPA